MNTNEKRRELLTQYWQQKTDEELARILGYTKNMSLPVAVSEVKRLRHGEGLYRAGEFKPEFKGHP